MAPADPSAPQDPPEAAVERVCAVLRRAIARVCSGDLASHREDLVQASLVRLLELRRRGEDFAARPSSYLWMVAYTTAVDELRRLQRRRAMIQEERAPQARAQPASPQPAPPPALRAAIVARVRGPSAHRRAPLAP